MLSTENFTSALNFLTKISSEDAKTLLLYQFRWELMENISTKWSEMIEFCLNSNQHDILTNFGKAVELIHNFYISYMQYDDTDSLALNEQLKLELKANLFHLISPQLAQVVSKVYEFAFGVFLRVRPNDGDVSMNGCCDGCGKEFTCCICSSLFKQFQTLNKLLSELDLLDRISGESAVKIASVTVKMKVSQSTHGCFDVMHLETLKDWLEDSIFAWLDDFYGISDVDSELNLQICEQQKERLLYLLHDSYACCLIEQLFSIIIDFPDSEPAIQDLKKCLERVSLRQQLISSLKKAVLMRLLHPGVNTNEILLAYTQAVKALRMLDPSGVIMDAVTQPIKKYLRNRSDTVRCIVSFLTDQKQMDLSAELIRDESLMLDTTDPDDSEDIDANIDWKLWQPDPVDALTSSSRRSRRSADIISMLVGVYGSKELFVKEYRQLLSERLLKDGAQALEKEARYLEILKIRFGESEMHQCQVMLKDMKDSDRVDQFVKDLDILPFPVHARIVSAHFWPKLREESVHLPNYIQQCLDTYNNRFETHKASRKLEWRQQLGAVQLELEMDKKIVSITCTPLQAVIIWHFQQKEMWTADELSRQLQVPQSLVKRRLVWWAGLGILCESSGHWTLSNRLPNQQRISTEHDVIVEDDDEEGGVSVESDVEKLEQYWTYISGLLRNLESLKADRVYSLLRMFSSPGQEGPSLETVNAFLQRKVKEQLLVHTGGVYKLAKK